MQATDKIDKPKAWRIFGPGLITGAADEDPSNIATYSQVGAQFGYQMLWTTWFLYPLVVAIQEISARIARVTGCGLATNMYRYYPRTLLYAIVVALLVANTINLAADLSAMAAAVKLLLGGPAVLYAIAFGVLSAALEILVKYENYARYLKWLALILLAYVATAFMAKVDWKQAAYHFAVPSVTLSADFLTGLLAIAGTTISPYLFFWQAGQEVEIEQETPGEQALTHEPRQAPAELKRIELDTLFGMGVSQVIAVFIVLTAAASLRGSPQTLTATQAAQALRPLAGEFAYLLFTIGIIGTGLLSIPALAASGAYAAAEALRLPASLAKRPQRAKVFYGTIAFITLVAALLNFFSFNPIRALYISSVINGIVSVPIMVVLMLMGSQTRVMGRFVLPRRLKLLGWSATGAMGLGAGVLIGQWL